MLLNVRLGPREQAAVRGLRRAKVNVSELVRRALRVAADEGRAGEVKPSARVKAIIAAVPDHAQGTPRRPQSDDRLGLRRHLRRLLKQKRAR